MEENDRQKIILINGHKTKYMVTDIGDVYSLDYKHTGKSHKLKTRVDKDGYVIVTIYLDGKRYDRKMHRLVAEAFIPNPENKPEVNHKNGDKKDNFKYNLEWTTNKENLNHARVFGLNTWCLNQEGESNATSLYSNKLIKKVCRALEKNKLTRKEISEKYGVSNDTLYMIITGRQWTHISDNYDLSKALSKIKRSRVIDDKTVIKICKLLAKGGLTVNAIANKVGVSAETVSRIYKRKTRQHISKDYDFSRVPKHH